MAADDMKGFLANAPYGANSVNSHRQLKSFLWIAPLEEMAEALRVDEEDMPAFSNTLALAAKAFSPRVWFQEVTIDALGDDFAMLSGEWFEGPRVATVLRDARQCWAFVATAGEKPAHDPSDVLTAWWLQALGENAVHQAIVAFVASMPCGEGEHLSTISPGSLPDWPITEQIPLFRLLGAPNAGVHLTESCLMQPRCSVSGLLFAAPRPFCSCAHCDKLSCPNRRADRITDDAGTPNA